VQLGLLKDSAKKSRLNLLAAKVSRDSKDQKRHSSQNDRKTALWIVAGNKNRLELGHAPVAQLDRASAF
jgi:hypothetical protein